MEADKLRSNFCYEVRYICDVATGYCGQNRPETAICFCPSNPLLSTRSLPWERHQRRQLLSDHEQ